MPPTGHRVYSLGCGDLRRLGASAIASFRRLNKLVAGRAGWSSDPEAALPQLLERLSVAIRSAKARAVLKRAAVAGSGGSVLDSAAAILDAEG